MSRSELTLSGGFIFPTSPSLLPAPFHLAGTESTMPKPKSKETLGLDDEAIFAAAGSGALPINDDELSAAFDFLDVDGSGRLTGAGIKHRLGAFFSNLPQKEIKLLLGEGPFTKDSLRKLLATNDLGTYDPVREAFRAYDPNGTGFADPEMLRSIFETLGYGPINEEDIKVLIETADADRDGKIGLEDFRMMMKTGARLEGTATGSGIAAMKGGAAPPES